MSAEVADDVEGGEYAEKRKHESQGDIAQQPAPGLAQTEKSEEQAPDARGQVEVFRNSGALRQNSGQSPG